MPAPADSVQMEVKGLMLDPTSNLPIVVLRDTKSKLFLPIWIGVFEANAIALRIEGVQSPRPMTHDLMRSFLDDLGAEVQRVLICDLKENTFYAEIHLGFRQRELTVDSRPSDALALALRTDAPIFVLRTVLEKAQAIDLTERLSRDERIKKWLEEVDPADLGEWEM
ncbi:MAG: bifunctional nuclease family protein [Thermoanaerobaculia bacterium]|nr:bifunctional nuclease family protein [Thermoanaerobaculia bacterium]